MDLSAHSEKFAPEYGPHGFTDHLPMAVTALRQLGADEARVDVFATQYQKKLKSAADKSAAASDAEIAGLMGDHGAYAAAKGFFQNALANEGTADVLARYLPELSDAVSTAAFHGVIRTAYGLIAELDQEIAAGLAYWWAHAKKIEFVAPLNAQDGTPEELMQDIAEAFRHYGGEVDLNQSTISAQMNAILRHRKLAAVLGRASVASVGMDKLTELALRLYFTKPDFTSLHCVTGAHAVRVIGENVGNHAGDLAKGYWNGLCAAFAAMGAPSLLALDKAAPKPPVWGMIAAAAIASDDDHDIKFAYTCREEARIYGRDLDYRRAAAHRLGISG